MQLTLILQLQVALFIAFLLLVICIIKILLQRKALYLHQQSIKLFKQSLNQYQESVELFRQAIDEYELLLKEHGINTSKLKAKAPLQLISPPPFPFKVTQQEIDINNKYLHSELTALTNNVNTANQLLTKQRQLYPGKSENWVLKQVISDFQRINYSKKNKRQDYERMIIILKRREGVADGNPFSPQFIFWKSLSPSNATLITFVKLKQYRGIATRY